VKQGDLLPHSPQMVRQMGKGSQRTPESLVAVERV
jgi:hypothetical protein